MLLGSPNMATSGAEERTRDPGGSALSSQAMLPSSIHGLLWEEKTRTLRELISSYRLPLAVKLKVGDISKFRPEDDSSNSVNNRISTTNSGLSSNGAHYAKFTVGSDSSSTLSSTNPESKDTASGKDGQDDVFQIHEIRRRKIILARKMTWEKRQNDYVVTGELVEIPASFKGWMEVVPDDGRPVEYFDTIGGITGIKPKRFLVRTSTVGYQLTTEENGNSCWMPNEIKPGEVLTTGIVYMDSKKNKNATQRNIFKRLLKQNKTKKDQDLKYLQCFDSSGGEIMIPLIMSGVFSPVGDSSMANYDAVYELQDLIMAFGLPVNAQLIHVNNKENYQCPRGVLRLYGTREEELVVVSKVGSDGALFRDSSNCDKFEVPVGKELLFSRGVVKKKPAIKAKLVDVFHSSHDKEGTSKHKHEDNDIKDKTYVRAKSMDEFKVRGTYERRPSTTLIGKTKPVTPSYISAYASTPSDEYRDVNRNKIGQEMAKVIGDTETSSTVLTGTGIQTVLTNSTSTHVNTINTPSKEQTPSKDVELPERAPKELKKSKSTGILDKLSVRKVRKDRAKLKELRGDDVFSKRIARSELSYQDFFNGLDDDEEDPKNSDSGKSKQDDSGRGSSNGTYQSNSSAHSTGTYSTSTPNTPSKTSSKPSSETNKSIQRRASIQNRDLPPIPPDSPRHIEPASPNHNINMSKESLYEHLPPAPQPPQGRRASESALLLGKHNDEILVVDDEEDEEDGYMVPMQVQQESKYVKRSDVQLRNKPPSFPNDSLKNARARKVRSELPQEFVHNPRGYDDGCPLDIDDLFSFAYSTNQFGEPRPIGTPGSQQAISTSHLYGASKVPTWRSELPGHLTKFDQRFMDNLDLEARGYQQTSRKSRQARHLNANPNATIRSHNLRKSRPNAMELFHFTDSFRDLQYTEDSQFHGFQTSYVPHTYDQQNVYPQSSRPPLLNSRSFDANAVPPQYQQQHQQNIYGPGYGMHYAESEPCFRHNHRAASVGETFFKHGDDSAISMCSKGDGGFPNESEYSYNEWEHAITDDGWSPPDQIEGMSVQEVSKSLRYIGMKDRVVLRFSNEQIDGSMLGTLDKKLLKEGFPELNALEVKKILDFVQGWRPKK